ncbi:aa_trans domain-containing protein [Trichonephila clavata]|uniref:Aa_trans domain-containing protein n=1 Tax=Trichonephila clavata TaxID=2740835 RepID=A0A8X6JS63_TRICU|nr:aa_trans domain-containing protein [Trichonephila clavata]
MEKVTTAVEEKLRDVLGRDALEQHANAMRNLKKKIQPTAMFKRPRGTLRDFSDQPKEEETTDPSEEKDDDALSVNMATLLVISIVTCDAIVSLPSSLKNSGWMGVFLVILCGVNSLCAGNLLGWCWNILQDVWPEYKEGSMIPYAEIGHRAVGLWMRNFVMVSQVVSQLTLAIGYLSNISKHIEGSSGGALKFCDMMVLTVFLIIPFTWFRAPKNFWYETCFYRSKNILIDVEQKWYYLKGNMNNGSMIV